MAHSAPCGLRIQQLDGTYLPVPLAIEAQGPAAILAYLAECATPAPEPSPRKSRKSKAQPALTDSPIDAE